MTFAGKILPLLASALILAACSPATTIKMQPSKDQPTVADPASKVTLLLTAHIKNENNPGYQLKVVFLQAEKRDAKGGEEKILHVLEPENALVGDWDSNADLRLVMDTGPQTLRLIWATSGSLMMLSQFHLPLHMDVNFAQPGVYYGGHIETVVRPREGQEFKAGPTVPLLQQGVSGASGGSFDVKIEDNYDADVAALRKKFPALEKVEIKKALLPAWDRKKAQDWWEKQ